MTKLLIASLLLLISIKAMSFTPADTGTYTSAKLIEVDIQACLDEIDLQYMGENGMVDYSNNITVKEMVEMEEECIREELSKK